MLLAVNSIKLYKPGALMARRMVPTSRPTPEGKKIVNINRQCIHATDHAVDRLRQHEPAATRMRLTDLVVEAAKEERNWIDHKLIHAVTARALPRQNSKVSYYLAHPTNPRGVFVLVLSPMVLSPVMSWAKSVDTVTVVTYLRFEPSQIALIFPWRDTATQEEKTWNEVAVVFDDVDFVLSVEKKIQSDKTSLTPSQINTMKRLVDFMKATLFTEEG